MTACPPLMYPEKFELALRFGEEGPLQSDPSLSDSDKVLLYALRRQAVDGLNKEPRPSMWDTVGKAKWNAWKELGNRSKMEAMFMYVQAVEEFNPEWWQWPELGLVEEAAAGGGGATAPSAAAPPAAPVPAPAANTAQAPSAGAVPVSDAPPAAPPTTADATDATPPMQLAPNALAVGGWSALAADDAPARYRHACAVVGARLFVYGGRSNSGRLAPDLFQLNLLTGKWSKPQTAGVPPDLRWGHSMSAWRQWLVIFGGHRRRGCLNDTTFFDSEAMAWEVPIIDGALPPPRGNHAAAVVSDRLWLFGGDAANSGVLPQTVWSLSLGASHPLSLPRPSPSPHPQPSVPRCLRCLRCAAHPPTRAVDPLAT